MTSDPVEVSKPASTVATGQVTSKGHIKHQSHNSPVKLKEVFLWLEINRNKTFSVIIKTGKSQINVKSATTHRILGIYAILWRYA